MMNNEWLGNTAVAVTEGSTVRAGDAVEPVDMSTIALDVNC